MDEISELTCKKINAAVWQLTKDLMAKHNGNTSPTNPEIYGKIPEHVPNGNQLTTMTLTISDLSNLSVTVDGDTYGPSVIDACRELAFESHRSQFIGK